MRLGAHSARASESAATLALLMGLVAAGGCVEKVVDPPAFPLDGDDGSSEDGSTGEDGMDAGITPDAGTGGSGSGGGGGKDAGGSEAQLSCISYCSANLRVCTDTWAQYMDMQQCLNVCDDWTRGSESDRADDTLGCRVWATNRADDTGDVTEYCNVSGPSGGGVCGENRCDVFCKGVTTLCTTANVRADDFEEPYASEDACLANCNGDFPVDPNDELPGSGNSVNCRIYHLSLAYRAYGSNEEQLAIHCGHTRPGEESGVCVGDFPAPADP